VRVGVGFYEASSDRLASIRSAIDDEAHGADLELIIEALTSAGWELGGEQLKTAPRGYNVDHPRIALLRHKSMTLAKDHGFEPVIHTAKLLDQVRDDWHEATPFVEWVLAHSKS